MILVLWLAACGGDGDGRRAPRPADTDTPGSDTSTVDTDTTPAPEWSERDVPGVRIGQATAGTTLAGPDAAFHGAQGVVSWVAIDADEVGVLHVARTTDGGATFGQAVAVPTPMSAVASWPRRPRLAIDASRLAVALEGEIDFESSQLGLFVSSTAGELDLRPVLNLEPTFPYDTYNYPQPAFASDGELWVQWVAGRGLDADAKVAREGLAWGTEQPNVDEDQPCECCPMSLVFAPDGDAVLAWRGDYVRDIHVLRARPPGGFDFMELASHLGWEELICPRDGPSLAIDDAGTTWLAFADASTGTMQARVTRRPLVGSWAESVRPLPADDRSQTRPTIGLDADGDVWVGFEQWWKGTYLLVESRDGGETWAEPVKLATPGGVLTQLRLVASEGGLRAVGIAADDGGVWVVELR